MNLRRVPDLSGAFEIGGSKRMLPMEGLRGIAVGLVFLQHYCMQFTTYTNLTGLTQQFATIFRNFGNCGVELFFVLSGYLIYGILLKKRPAFFEFMARRAQRLYPAFLVAFAIGAFADFARTTPKIPSGLADRTAYLFANLFFLPGLFPIEPLFAVNWSLSYEWWFYATATILFSVLRLAGLPAAARVSLIVGLGTLLMALSASGLPNVPIRGLCLLGGMLLAEADIAKLRSVPGAVGWGAALAAFILYVTVPLHPWLGALVLALGFCALCSAAFGGRPIVAAPLSWRYLRWFGNISYSYYLVHAYVAVVAVQALLRTATAVSPTLLFWGGLVPVFALTFCAGAGLFLTVERPFSLQRKAPIGHPDRAQDSPAGVT